MKLQPNAPLQEFNVNGVVYTPLPYEERVRQLQALEARRREVEAYLDKLDKDLASEDAEEAMEAVSDALARSMASFEWWCDHFCFTFDPRDSRNPYKRFILYDYQRHVSRETLRVIRGGGNLLEDKSRDMGASWLKMALFTWCWLFDESFHALIGSRKEDLVDDFTIDSLFGKMDCILERLPPWMLRGYTRAKNRKKLRLEHPCGNLITGESANRDFGRGPRKNVVYLDEFAFWEFDRTVWTSVQDTAPCKIVTSTPYGETNCFGALRFAESKDILILTLHWSAHPGKDLTWYNQQCMRRDPIAIAQELNIDYKASAGKLAFPQLQSHRSKILMNPVEPQDPEHDYYTFYAGLDWGSTNPSSFHVYRVLKLQEGPPRRFRVQSIWEYFKPSTLGQLADAIKGCPYFGRIKYIYCDPSMFYFNQQDTVKRATTSLAMQLRDYYGIHVSGGRRGDTLVMEKVREMWDQEHDTWEFRISEDCPNQIREFEGLRYAVQSAFMDQKRNAPETLVDKNNHSFDDFKYFLNSLYDAKEIPVKGEDLSKVDGWKLLESDLRNLKKEKIKRIVNPRPVERRRYFDWR